MSEIKITYKFDPQTGQTIEFTIDDQLPNAPEAYHDELTRLLAGQLAQTIAYQDAVTSRQIADFTLGDLRPEETPAPVASEQTPVAGEQAPIKVTGAADQETQTDDREILGHS